MTGLQSVQNTAAARLVTGARCRARITPSQHSFLSFDATSPGNPANIRINLMIIVSETIATGLHFCRRQYWSVYLHSDLLDGLRRTHVLCNIVRNGRSRSSKVVDFGTTRKKHMRLISDQQQPWSFLAVFLRYGDLLDESHQFSVPHSY